MFSITTTVSSMMRPMATARPPSDIRLSVVRPDSDTTPSASPSQWRK
jgi:hypothetical protein